MKKILPILTFLFLCAPVTAFAQYGGGGGGLVWGSGPQAPGYVTSLLSSAINATEGFVLGTSTEAGPQCSKYLTGYISIDKQNDASQVTKLQKFLNDLEGNKLAVNGTYDAATLAAVNAFQSKYASDVLVPWGTNQPTGFVYYTTQKEINTIYCHFTKQFPLSGSQVAEIARIKGLGESYNPGVVLGASTSNPAKPATGTTTNIANKPATTTGTVASTTASTTGAKGRGGFWGTVYHWFFSR